MNSSEELEASETTVDSSIRTSESDVPQTDSLSDATVEKTAETAENSASATPVVSGPLNLEQIRRLREQQNTVGEAKSVKTSPEKSASSGGKSTKSKPKGNSNRDGAKHLASSNESQSGSAETDRADLREDDDAPAYTASKSVVAPKVEKPNLRSPLPSDLENELEAALSEADLDGLMIGDRSSPIGTRILEEGSRVSAKIIKLHNDSVFISLGGPDEGVLPLLQFTDMPKVDDRLEVLIRAFNSDDGLYECAIPGEATSVEDWSDIQEGLIVEATVESSNTGGLECKVGGIRGFIPMRQISEYRVEDPTSYIGQKLVCVVLEANPARGNLVLSHRAILEREKAEKRAERLASLEIGQTAEGIVRKITDFGAFVDLGGLDGLIHISQLSYERVKHPSEILNEGEKVQVRIEKIDPETGKIGLSYRSLQDHPWADIDSRFPMGAIVKGTVSRIANFGAFVKLATGVEGLIHVSELAHRRVASVASVVNEGDEIEVKILTVDREAQRIGLSLKAVQAPPAAEAGSGEKVEEAEEPARKPVVSKYSGPLKGGTSSSSQGEKFGLKW